VKRIALLFLAAALAAALAVALPLRRAGVSPRRPGTVRSATGCSTPPRTSFRISHELHPSPVLARKSVHSFVRKGKRRLARREDVRPRPAERS